MHGMVLNISARGVVIICQLLAIKLYTTNVTASELGLYFFLLSTSYMLNAIIFIPLDYFQQAKLRVYYDSKEGLAPLFNLNKKLLIFIIITSLIIAIILFALNQEKITYFILLVVLAYLLFLVTTLRNTLNNLGFGSSVSVSFVSESISKVLIFYATIQYYEAGAEEILISWIFSLCITLYYLASKMMQYGIFNNISLPPTQSIKATEVINFSYPFSISACCNWVQLQGYRIILVPLGYSEIVGIYATLSSIGSAIIGAASLIYHQQFSPKIYSTAGQYTKQYMKGASAVFVFILLAMILTGEFLVVTLTSETFSANWEIILFGILTDGMNIFIGALAIHSTLVNKTKTMIFPAFLGAITIVFSFFALHFLDKLSLITIGIPLVVAQWTIVYFMRNSINKTNMGVK